MEQYYGLGSTGPTQMQILDSKDYQTALIGVGILLFLLIGMKALGDK